MTKKVKIALALGATAVIAVVGIVAYNRMSKNGSTARKYLNDVDENGGEPLASETAPQTSAPKVRIPIQRLQASKAVQPSRSRS